jgi:hypothetical protein
MEQSQFEHYMGQWVQILPALNTPLDDWRNQPAGWFTILATLLKLKRRKSPLDLDPALHDRFKAVTGEMAEVYLVGNDEQRASIRSLVKRMTGIQYFMAIPASQIRSFADASKFRLALLFESMADLRDDTRDVILLLDELCRAGRKAGIDVDRYRNEIAQLSSDVNHHGLGSMRSLLSANVST